MEMTIDQANERISALDDLIFKADTSQISVTWDEYVVMKIEVEALMEQLAKTMAAPEHTYEEMYAMRQRIRTLDRLSAIMHRHCDLNPEDAKNTYDPLLNKALHSGLNGDEIDNEAFARFMHQFDYLFANCPQPPAEKKPSFMRRLLGRK
jgi:hypothetical protein